MSKSSRVEEATRLLEMLLENRGVYFDKRGYLNSEGMKVAVRVARILAEELPQYHGLVRGVRERRNYEEVLKLLRDLEELVSFRA